MTHGQKLVAPRPRFMCSLEHRPDSCTTMQTLYIFNDTTKGCPVSAMEQKQRLKVPIDNPHQKLFLPQNTMIISEF